jgi:hypothetical protein
MTEQKFDYYSEALAFLKLKAGGTKTTQEAYCSRRAAETGFDVSFQYFKKTLAKIRRERNPRLRTAKTQAGPETPLKSATVFLSDPAWPELHDAYVCGKFRSLSAVAARVGTTVDSRGFKEATRGWAKERRELAPAVQTKTAEQLTRAGAVAKVRDLYAEALAAHYALLDIIFDSAEHCRERWTDPDKSPWHTQMAAQAALDLAKAMEKILPAIKGLENLKAIHKIFDNLSAGGDIVTAALDLARLGVAMPKPIEILLARHKPDETPPDDGETVTDEAIMKRRAELLAQIENERVDFVPERKRMVAKLKAETADSFKAQANIEKKEK